MEGENNRKGWKCFDIMIIGGWNNRDWGEWPSKQWGSEKLKIVVTVMLLMHVLVIFGCVTIISFTQKLTKGGRSKIGRVGRFFKT